MKKLLTLLFALAITVSLSAGAFAQESGGTDQAKDKKEMKMEKKEKKAAHKGAKKHKKEKKEEKSENPQ